MTSLENSVLNGAILLDEKFPLWWEMVNVDTLEQSNGYRCVLGQLYGSFGDGMMKLFPGHHNNSRYDIAKEYGYDGANEYDAATSLWKGEINSRRATNTPSKNANRHVVSARKISQAKEHIAKAIEQHEAYVPDLTESGVLLHVLMSLGIQLEVK